jgi:hypothetical protein
MADDKSTRLNTSPAGAQAADDEVSRLRKENAELRVKLTQAEGAPNTRPEPTRPSFGLTEGERSELQERGVTTDPFTGELLTAKSEGVEPSNDGARETSERFAKQSDKSAK